MPKVKRLNLVNSITGIKPGNLIGSISQLSGPNLAIISSVVHLSSTPGRIGFLSRPHGKVRRDTYQNIMENKAFTINHITAETIENAHYTSAKFEANISEFDVCKLTEEYIEGFPAPFVKESAIKIGLSLEEIVPIKSSGTTLIVGNIEHLVLPDSYLNEQYYINLVESNSVGISGLNSYYQLQYVDSFPFARAEDVSF